MHKLLQQSQTTLSSTPSHCQHWRTQKQHSPRAPPRPGADSDVDGRGYGGPRRQAWIALRPGMLGRWWMRWRWPWPYCWPKERESDVGGVDAGAGAEKPYSAQRCPRRFLSSRAAGLGPGNARSVIEARSWSQTRAGMENVQTVTTRIRSSPCATAVNGI